MPPPQAVPKADPAEEVTANANSPANTPEGNGANGARLPGNPYLTTDNQVNPIVARKFAEIKTQVTTARQYRMIIEDPKLLEEYRAELASEIKDAKGKPVDFNLPDKDKKEKEEGTTGAPADDSKEETPTWLARITGTVLQRGKTDREFVDQVAKPVYEGVIKPGVEAIRRNTPSLMSTEFSEKWNPFHYDPPAFQKHPDDKTQEQVYADILDGNAYDRLETFIDNLRNNNPFALTAANRDMTANEVLQLLTTVKYICELSGIAEDTGEKRENLSLLGRFIELSARLQPEFYRESSYNVLDDPRNLFDYFLAQRLDLVRFDFDPQAEAFASLRAPKMLREVDSAMAAAEALVRISNAGQAFKNALTSLYSQDNGPAGVDLELAKNYYQGLKQEFFERPKKAIETRMAVALVAGYLTGLDGKQPQSEQQSIATGLELRRLFLTEPNDTNRALYQAYEWASQRRTLKGKFTQPLEQMGLEEVEKQLAELGKDGETVVKESKALIAGLSEEVQPYLKLIRLYQNHPLNTFKPNEQDLTQMMRKEGDQWVTTAAFARTMSQFEALSKELYSLINNDLKTGSADIDALLKKFVEQNRGRNLVNDEMIGHVAEWFKNIYKHAEK